MQRYTQISFSAAMSSERFKQEAALSVLNRLLDIAAPALFDALSDSTAVTFEHKLERLEAELAPRLGAIAESISDVFVGKFGPDLTPGGPADLPELAVSK